MALYQHIAGNVEFYHVLSVENVLAFVSQQMGITHKTHSQTFGMAEKRRDSVPRRKAQLVGVDKKLQWSVTKVQTDSARKARVERPNETAQRRAWPLLRSVERALWACVDHASGGKGRCEAVRVGACCVCQ